jgi:hypothetical protein
MWTRHRNLLEARAEAVETTQLRQDQNLEIGDIY